MSTFASRLSARLHRMVPTREQLEKNRLVRPLARRSELLRFTRRSVPRGVSVGLLVGIFAMIPGIQIVGAALLCMPFRANVPLAVAMTFLSNPATTARRRRQPPLRTAAAPPAGSGMSPSCRTIPRKLLAANLIHISILIPF